MKLNFIITRLQAQIEKEQENFEHSYSTLTDDTKVWCMIDLVGSSNYRLLNGPKLGYVRGETFFSLIKNVIKSDTEVRLIKEIGDAVLLASNGIRPILESLILINQIALNLEKTKPKEYYPFQIKSGISFGVSKRLIRQNEDFLGSSIDMLARIMNVKSSNSRFFIQEEAYSHFKNVIKEYDTFLKISEVKKMSQDQTKDMLKSVLYREVNIDLEELLKFNDHFVKWKKN
ncbi:hypothetical protein [uncultured Psychroserpens sp.]|uniref:hypothetical protein n=1 Tax=uncultured Psychroserpens sp. TaxID=255436 RepID=UPI00261BC63B|nr:hypothetical protein [uncultured Psychroserpens sp.]